MAKKWYPVIDILSCVECGTCVNFCPHGVYDKKKSPVPVVVNSEGCIDHCHGCGNKCPQGAISVGHFLRTVHTCYPFLFSAPAFALV